MRAPRLGVKARLLVAVVCAVGIALVGAVTAFNLLLGQRLSASATALARAQADALLSSLEVEGGRVVPPDGRQQGIVSAQGWVFDGPRVLEAPRASPTETAAARSLEGGPERSLDLDEEARLYALPVVRAGVRYGTVVSAVSLDPYEQTGRAAMIGSLILACLLLAAVTLISRWMLGRALLPVSRMTESAATWSEHDLDRRFDLGEPYDELTRLAATLDGLLERNAASLRHEQRFAAELSHELRTPLARAKAETELMLRRHRTADEYRLALEAIDRNVDEMTRTVEALMAAARQEAGLTQTTSDLREAVSTAVSSAREAAGDGKIRVALPREPVRVRVDQDLLTRIVQPLVENALRYGRSAVEVELVRNGSVACIDVVDDGPGIGDDECDLIFEPGTRGRAGSHRDDGAGLGLALARRLARSAGGEIVVGAGAAGGRFSLRLPVA
jgi:two-component system, OmpR family, sensor kinase